MVRLSVVAVTRKPWRRQPWLADKK